VRRIIILIQVRGVNPGKVIMGQLILNLQKLNQMINKLLISIFLISGSFAYAQQVDNRVFLAEISGNCSVSQISGMADINDSYKGVAGTYNKERLQNDRPAARRFYPPYRILNSRYVSRSTITKTLTGINEVKIRLMMNGVDNTDIEDFSMAFDSGNEYHMNNTYGIENISLPLYVKVKYRSWNAFHAVQFDVTYEFIIYSPGSWNVNIFN
jgi:hypothetical protein